MMKKITVNEKDGITSSIQQPCLATPNFSFRRIQNRKKIAMDLQGRVRNDADQAYESDVNKVFTQAEVPHANPDPDQVNVSLGTQ